MKNVPKTFDYLGPLMKIERELKFDLEVSSTAAKKKKKNQKTSIGDPGLTDLSCAWKNLMRLCRRSGP